MEKEILLHNINNKEINQVPQCVRKWCLPGLMQRTFLNGIGLFSDIFGHCQGCERAREQTGRLRTFYV